MKLTFDELSVNMANYNGQSAALAEQSIINSACEYVMNNLINNPTVEEDCVIPWPKDAKVDFVSHKVSLYVNRAYITIH